MEASYGGVCATTVNKDFECFTPRSTYFEGKLNVAQPPLHVQQFDVDLTHTCLLLNNNRMKCLGQSVSYALGTNAPFGASVNLPCTRYHRDDAVPKLIKTGQFSTCTLMTDGTVTCFGARLDFETRHALETRWPWEPAAQLKLGPNRTVASVEVGNYFVSLVTTEGKLMSIGHGPAMGLGNTTTYFYDYNSTMEEPRFVNVGTGRTVKQVAVFRDHSCVILDNDGLKCFGSNEFGQLGLGISDPEYGTTDEQMGDALPYVNLGDGRFAKQVSVAANHTCVLLDNDHVKCFGDNSAGQLGIGDRRSRGSRPEDMGNNLEYVYFVQPQDSSFLWVVIGASVGGICFLGIVIAVVFAVDEQMTIKRPL